MKETISFKLNGKPTSLTVDGKRNLLWILRNDLGLTGTKFGCGERLCGTCSIIVDKEVVRSCQYPVENVKGKEVITIEGLAVNGKLHPLQDAFVEHNAMQCGFCTPGMIMNAYGLILNKSNLSREDIINGMEDNLCRCGAHKRIIEAIQTVAK